MSGLRSLFPTHEAGVIGRVRGNEAGLARMLLSGPWNLDLQAIRQEGGCR